MPCTVNSPSVLSHTIHPDILHVVIMFQRSKIKILHSYIYGNDCSFIQTNCQHYSFAVILYTYIYRAINFFYIVSNCSILCWAIRISGHEYIWILCTTVFYTKLCHSKCFECDIFMGYRSVDIWWMSFCQMNIIDRYSLTRITIYFGIAAYKKSFKNSVHCLSFSCPLFFVQNLPHSLCVLNAVFGYIFTII